MANLKRTAPQVSVVLASLILWVSFAWGLPAAAPATEAEADVAAEDPWAGVRISDAYEYLECPACWAFSEPTAAQCPYCGYEFPHRPDVAPEDPWAGVRISEAAAAAEDPWAGVRISDAYDYAKCHRCGKKNEVRAESCSRCGYELPQPSAEITDPEMVFVPGKGYYREGTLVEPARTKKGLWVTGLVLTATVVGTGLVMGVGEALYWWQIPEVAGIVIGIPLFVMSVVGISLLIYGLVSRTEAVYAFESGERFEPYERPAFALRSSDSDGAALKVDVTVLGF